MDLNQEDTHAHREDTDSTAVSPGSDGRLLGAALGGAVGILASRLLGVSPRLGITIGSLVGANTERIGPHIFPGKLSDADEDPGAGIVGQQASKSGTSTAKDLLRDLAHDRSPDGLPQSLQDVLDDYLALDDDDEVGAVAETSPPTTKKAPEAEPILKDHGKQDTADTEAESVPLNVERKSSDALPGGEESAGELTQTTKRKKSPAGDIESLPIAPPLQPQIPPLAPESRDAKPPEENKVKSGPAATQSPISKVSVGQAPPAFPQKPVDPQVSAPETDAGDSFVQSRPVVKPLGLQKSTAAPASAGVPKSSTPFEVKSTTEKPQEAASKAASISLQPDVGPPSSAPTAKATEGEPTASPAVQSLWSQPPSTSLADERSEIKTDEEVLSATGVPEATSSSTAPASQSRVRGAAPTPVSDEKSEFLLDEASGSDEAPSDKELKGHTQEGIDAATTTAEAKSAPAAPTHKPPVLTSTTPAGPSPGSSAVVGPTSLPGQALFKKPTFPPTSTPAPSQESTKSADSEAKSPLFRPAPKPLGTGSAPSAVAPAEPVTSVSTERPPEVIATSPAGRTTSPFPQAPPPGGKAAAPPAQPEVTEPTESAGAVAKPALFTNIPPVSQSVTQTATKLPVARKASPPPLGKQLQADAESAAPGPAPASQESEATDEQAFSRLFKPKEIEESPVSPASADEPAPPLQSNTPGSAPTGAPKSQLAGKGPNPFMTATGSAKPGAALPPPLPVSAPDKDKDEDAGTAAPPAGNEEKANLFSPSKTVLDEKATTKADVSEINETQNEAPVPGSEETQTPGSAPVADRAPGKGPAAVESGTLPAAKPKWKKSPAPPVESDDTPSVVATSQSVATKSVKGSVVEESSPDDQRPPDPADDAPKKLSSKQQKKRTFEPLGEPSTKKKGGVGRKLLLLSFPVVAAGLAVVGFKLKPEIIKSLSGLNGMIAPSSLPQTRTSEPGDFSIKPTPPPDGGSSYVPSMKGEAANNVPNSGTIEQPSENSLPDSPNADAVAMPEGTVVQILPAGDVPLRATTEINPVSEGIVEPEVKEFEDAKSVVQALLMSTSTAEAANWVHDKTSSEQMMKQYYGSTGITPIESVSIDLVNAGTVPGSDRKAYLMKVISPDHPAGFPVSIEQTSDGYKVDWDAFIQCKDRLLEKYYSSQSVVPEPFYVTLKRSHHFAPTGSGEPNALEKKLCFKVSSPLPTDPSQYAYADSNSVVGRELDARVQWNKVYFPVVELEWVPSDGKHDGYMRISRFVRDTWRRSRK